MSPVYGGYDPLEAPPAQDVLDAKRDQGRVLGIVIEGVAAGDALDHEPGSFVQRRGDLRLPLTEDPAVGFGQVTAECIRQKARWNSTWLSPKARVRSVPGAQDIL